MTPKKYLEPVLLIGLAFLTFLVYGQVIHHEFVNYDVPEFITENPFVRTGFSLSGIRWAFTNGDVGDWHPLTWISLMLDSEVFGLRAGWHHLMNVWYHFANVILFFFLIKKITKNLFSSAFAAAVFAVHPLHVESVAWAAERKDVLSALFWLMTILVYFRCVRKEGRFHLLPVVFCYGLAIMSKPMVVTLPFVLILLDYWPLGRLKERGIWPLVAEKAPLWAFSFAACFMTFWFKWVKGGVPGEDLYPLGLRTANALVSYVRYLEKTFWPFDLAVFYPYPKSGIAPAAVLGSILLLSAVTVFVLRYGKKYPHLPVGWFWFLGTLVPVIGLIQTGGQAMADRYTYIPHMGFFLMLIPSISGSLSSWRYRTQVLGAGFLIAITFFSVLAWRQVGYWQSTVTLNEHALRVTNRNDQAHNNLGAYYESRGEFEKAAFHFARSLEIRPENPDVANNLASVLLQSGRVDEAIRLYRAILAVSPRHFNALLNLGLALMEKGTLEEAELFLRRALEENPRHPKPYLALADIFRRNGHMDQARELLSKMPV